MKKEELQNLTKESLVKKEKANKTMIGIFIPIILLFVFFTIRDYMNGKEHDFLTTTMIICCLGGIASLYPELKNIKQEMNRRGM